MKKIKIFTSMDGKTLVTQPGVLIREGDVAYTPTGFYLIKAAMMTSIPSVGMIRYAIKLGEPVGKPGSINSEYHY